jgi:hypothetical protein
MGSALPPIQWVEEGVKRPRPEAGHSSTSRDEVKSGGSIFIFILNLCLKVLQLINCIVQDR